VVLLDDVVEIAATTNDDGLPLGIFHLLAAATPDGSRHLPSRFTVVDYRNRLAATAAEELWRGVHAAIRTQQ
jgi:hypothetical protein